MKNLKIVVAALLLFAVLAGIGLALTPPPPPPPPVNQTSGIDDTTIDLLQTTGTDQGACRQCHLTSGTVVPGGYSNTVGGVPTRHHNLLPRGVINPLTNAPFGCPDCHPSTPGVGNGILLDRSCVVCHNGTSFYANSIGGNVGNFSRPHHVNTSYASSNIGNPAAARTCNFCHGSFIANFNDGHYKPDYATDSLITPFATFKVTNTSQPDGLGGNKVWGGCLSCHVGSVPGTANIDGVNVQSNYYNHHKEINGFSRYGGTTPYQNATTPGYKCNWCHVINKSRPINLSATGSASGYPLYFNTTNPFTGELLVGAMEVRNSTVEADINFEVGTTNISINGTGCEKCHDVRTLHNIVGPGYTQNGPQGVNHINNNLDCNGCHDQWLPADAGWIPTATVPSVTSISPAVIAAGTPTTLTITGTDLKNDVTQPDGSVKSYTSVVSIDGVQYVPASITATQIVVDVPALDAGTHQLQLVKNDVLSKLDVLTVVPAPVITSAKLTTKRGVTTLTILGTGFGTKPANAQYYVSVKDDAGNQIISNSLGPKDWTNTQIKVKNPALAPGRVVTVITAASGEVTATIE